MPRHQSCYLVSLDMANYGKYYIAVRLLLIKQYLEANAGRNRIVKRWELEQLLEEHDMPVEKKTLYADFTALGDVCGLQLEYDVHKKGYRLLNPPFEPYELRLLVDSVQSSKFITREKAREITAKLKRFAGKDTVESLNRENHVANRVRSMNDSVVKDADRIHEAIRKAQKSASATSTIPPPQETKRPIHCDFSAHNQTASLLQKVAEKGCGLTVSAEFVILNFLMPNFHNSKRNPLKSVDFRGFGAASQI